MPYQMARIAKPQKLAMTQWIDRPRRRGRIQGYFALMREGRRWIALLEKLAEGGDWEGERCGGVGRIQYENEERRGQRGMWDVG
jgi:hypothetical protein